MRKRVAGKFVRESSTGPDEEQPDKAAKKRRGPRPGECRSYTRKRVAEALPEILEAFVGEAKKGSIPHAKILTILSGLDKGAVTDSPRRRGASLSAVLMAELKKQNDDQSQS